jgi:RNA polymerase sigma-70 factor (ECF subfamily)
MAATFVNSAEDAKDIYQEVFMRVYRGLPKFELRSEFSTWLFRITSNVCITHRKQRKRHTHTSLGPSEGSDDDVSHHSPGSLIAEETSDRQLVQSDIRSQVEEALKSLSPRQKLVFTLRFFEGKKLREIAEMIDCTEGTAKKYLFTATQKVRQILGQRFN